MLGVYQMTTTSEQTVAQNSMDSIEELADLKAEVLDARIEDSVILIDSHAQQESKVFMIDFVMEDGSTERVMYSQEGANLDDFVPKEMTRMTTDAPEIGAGEVRSEIDLNALGIEKSKIKSASFLTENGNRFIIDVPKAALQSVDDGGEGGTGTTWTGAGNTDVDGDGSVTDRDDINGDGVIDGQDVAIFMITSMGLQSKIIKHDVGEASVIHGTFVKNTINETCDMWTTVPTFDADIGESIGDHSEGSISCRDGALDGIGTEVSLKPYLDVASDNDFAALIKKSDTQTTIPIPKFFEKYEYDGDGTLLPIITEFPNNLGYTIEKILYDRFHWVDDHSEDVEVTITNNGITVSGEGEVIVRLNDYAGQKMWLSSDGSYKEVKILTSEHDLTEEPRNGVLDGHEGVWNKDHGSKGVRYMLHYSNGDFGAIPIEILAGKNEVVRWNGNGLRGVQSFVVQYEGDAILDSNGSTCYRLPGIENTEGRLMGVVEGKLFEDGERCRYGQHFELSTKLVKEDKGTHYIITNDDLTLPPIDVNDNPYGIDVAKVTSSSGDSESDPFYVIADDVPPGKTLKQGTHGTPINEGVVFPSDDTYLYVNNWGDPVTIKGVSVGLDVTENPEPPWLDNDDILLYVINAPPNIPYQIIRDSVPIVSGMSSPDGIIIVGGFDKVEPVGGGTLILYPDSLAERAQPWHTLVFDDKNRKTLHPDSDESIIYTPHAYAKIYVTGDVTVTDFSLDGTLPLPYLNKEYIGGNEIHIPIVPEHHTIHLKINGMATTLPFKAIQGGTGTTVAEPVNSVIKKVDLESPIYHAEATAGTTAFAIASSDGDLIVVISETISGEVKITNSYLLENPPRPPAPRPWDPLSGGVVIYINGDEYSKVVLGENKFPPGEGTIATPTNQGDGTTLVIREVHYEYPDFTFTGATTIPVNIGDFVEFYVYANVNGEIDEYDVPNRFTLLSESGESRAEANIRSAHISTDM